MHTLTLKNPMNLGKSLIYYAHEYEVVRQLTTQRFDICFLKIIIIVLSRVI